MSSSPPPSPRPPLPPPLFRLASTDLTGAASTRTAFVDFAFPPEARQGPRPPLLLALVPASGALEVLFTERAAVGLSWGGGEACRSRMLTLSCCHPHDEETAKGFTNFGSGFTLGVAWAALVAATGCGFASLLCLDCQDKTARRPSRARQGRTRKTMSRTRKHARFKHHHTTCTHKFSQNTRPHS